MELLTKQYSWQSDDAAEIHFSRQTQPFQSDDQLLTEPPEHITAVQNQCSLLKPPTVKIPLDDLEFLVACECHARGGNIKWNSNTKCAAYQWCQRHGGKPKLVIFKVDGLGNHWMLMDQLEILTSFQAIVENVEPIVVWDLITSWFSTYSRGHNHGTIKATEEHRTAFVEGRLKKRKHRGRDDYRVWITQRAA